MQLDMILVSNLLSMIAIIYLIFVPWKKGPEWYTRHSFKLFKSLLYLNYVWLPLINIAITVFFTLNPKYDLKLLPLESWVVFFSVVCFARIVEFYSSLRKIVMDDARIFLSLKKDKEKGSEESQPTDSVLEKDEVTLFAESERDKIIRERQEMEEHNDGCTDYFLRNRMYGEGEIRIGNALQLSDDIYNFGFICQIRNDIIDKHIDVLKKKLDRKDVVRKKANRLHTAKKKQETVE